MRERVDSVPLSNRILLPCWALLGVLLDELIVPRPLAKPQIGLVVAARISAKLTNHHRDPFKAALVEQLPGLRRHAIALVGNVGAAEDLVQDCIERALTRSETLREFDRIGPWLRTILHNIYVDRVRREQSAGIGTELELLENNHALSTLPDDRGVRIDFVRAFGRLTLEHRRILLLVGLEGLRYQEISAELSIPIGTVMSRLARAREGLRNALELETNLATPGLPKSEGRVR